MRQIFTKNKNVPDGRTSAVRRVLAFVVLAALCCVSCRNVIEAPEETAEIAESGGGEGTTGKLYTLSGAVGAGGAVPSSLAANSRSAAFGDMGGGIENSVCGDAGTADGTAIQSGRAAAANARSATYSSGQLTGVSYTVTATTVSSPDSDKNPPGTEKTVKATVVDDGSHRFYIELLEGTYTLSVEGFLGEGDGRKKILEGTYRNADSTPANTVTIDEAHPNPQVGTIYVNPIFGGSGTGTVSLTLSMAADCNIKCLKAVWEADGTQKTKTFTDGGNDLTAALFTMTADGEASSDIPAGFHRVDFYFYGDEGGTDELYSCSQSINVYQNLTTGLWRNNGATPYIDDAGNFTLTRSVIYSRKLFYVHNSSSDDTGEGTRYNPFKSVKAAVRKIEKANDGASEYKIALLSDDTEDENAPSYSADTNFSYICINPDKHLKLIIESDLSESRDTNRGNPFTIDANRNSTNTGRVMYIGQNAEVTLNNIKITGGYAGGTGGDVSTTIGGGVWVSGGTFIMESGTQISGNTADYGGGVRVNGHSLGEKGGTFIMNGGTISGNTAVNDGGGLCVCDADAITLSSGLIADNRAAAGGGIYFEGSGTDSGGTVMFTMSGTTVSGNTATYNSANSYGGDGGGIYIDGSSVEMTACTIGGSEDAESNSAEKSGGGIYNQGTLTVSGGSVTNCTAATSGGGIYNDVTDASITCTLTDCTISGCKALGTDGANGGGGIYNNAGTLELTNCTITGGGDTGNPDARYGGGINVHSGSTLTMTGSEITNCTATLGGGVFYNGGASDMTGCTVSGNKATGNGGGIYLCGGKTFTMKGGTISGNEAATNGGGMFVSGVTFVIEYGEITGNSATTNGGGVHIDSGSTLTVKDGAKISKNNAKFGGGVSFLGGTFIMRGGTISENGASSCGGGIYRGGATFTMGGSASVPAGDDGKNDVYLASGKTIGIASALTATTPVATITPNAYTAGTQVVSAADGSTATLAANYEKFAVTAESDGTEWLITENGTLKSSVPEGFTLVNGGTVVGDTNNYAGVFIAGRTVTLKSFYMCDHEVTQGEWKKAMASSQNTSGVTESPSYCTAANSATYGVKFGSDYDNRPVENVTWYDAVYYCNIRSEQEGLTKAYDISGITQSGGHITAATTVSLVSDADGYRLPTEAEWEFAARGGAPNAEAWDYTFSGAKTAEGTAYYAVSNSGMDSVGWYSWNNKDGTTGAASVTGDASGKGTHEVKQKEANALGIYDMSGNVNEWCWDWYDTVASDTPGTGPASGSSSSRVIRGGAWNSDANYCSVSLRNNVPPSCCNDNVGFRVVRSVSQ